MPTPDIGEVGRQVAANVQRLRLAHEMSLRDLSAKLAELGRPILASGLVKIERAERRVDVDDLSALATALGTLPNRLLTELPDAVLTAEQYMRNQKAIRNAAESIATVIDDGVSPRAVLDYLDRAVFSAVRIAPQEAAEVDGDGR
ncbi:helix-turn-helix domain-containing protein [Actinoplanes philippinensis]|uniref:helix-turn-helix domain-containing protein n=1 Tax=Actinoplanes philippinensis TaxID=35752 RepID=UPI0033EC6D59